MNFRKQIFNTSSEFNLTLATCNFFSSFFVIFAVSLSLIVTFNTASAQNWDWQNPKPQGVNLYSVCFPDANTGYTAGLDGTILKTTNAGADWTELNTGTSNSFVSVFFTDIDTGYVVGQTNTMLKTTNGGLDWTQISIGSPYLTSIFFTSTSTGYAVGSNGVAGTILKTTNGGINWTVQNTATVTLYNSVYFCNDSTGYVVGEGGKILKTIDGGNNWINQTSGVSNSLYSVYFTDADNGYATEYGRILKTTNGGLTWTYQTYFQSFELYSVHFSDFNTGYAVGRSGVILKTTNAGANWNFLTSETTIKLRDVHFTDNNTGYSVGENGIILKTIDAGTNWTAFSTSEYYADLNDANFPDVCRGYSVGKSGTILKTADGGTNWIAQNSGITNDLFSVYFTSTDIGYVVGDTGLILKTIDGGINWNTQNSGLMFNLNSVYFTNVDTGYVVGDGGKILKTIDGGANWLIQISNVSENLTSVYFLDDNVGFAVGSSGRILKTTDGGNVWNIIYSGTTLDLRTVYFPTAQIGYVGGVSGHIRKTINGGTSWTQLTNNINFVITSLVFSDANNGFAVGYDYNRYGKIFNTTNGGTNWSSQTISWDHDLKSVKYVDTNTLYIVGNNGAILKTIIGASVAGNNGPICEGQALILSAPTISNASYLWTGPNGFTSNLQNPTVSNISTVSMNGTYSVSIMVNACTNIIETTIVLVNTVPSSPTILNNGPICEGEVLNLSATGITDATYSWSGPNGFTSNQQNPAISSNATAAMSGTYSLVTTLNGCSSSNGTTSVVVNTIPTTPNIINNGSFCEGLALSLSTATISDATYSWSGPNGFTSNQQNPTISSNATAAMNGTYSLTTTLNGCSSLTGSMAVIINTIPATPSIINIGPICEGSALSLSTQTISGATYSWSGPNGFTSNQQNPNISSNATAAMSGTYSLSAILNGCSSLNGTSEVIINPIPSTPSIINNGPICEGTALLLSTASISGATYSWSGPNGFTSNQQNPTISLNATATMGGTYSLATILNGCTSLNGISAVVVNPIPSTPSIINNGSFCEGSPLLLSTASLTDGTFSWSGPNGFASNMQSPTVSSNATAAMSGTYSLSTTLNGCSSLIGTSEVIINPIPAAPSASSNGPIDLGSTLTLSASTIPGATYFWTGPNGFSSSLQNPTVSTNSTLAMAGNYEVYVIVSSCTSSISSVLVVVNSNVGLTEELSNSTMSIYPNPASDKISIEIGESKGVFLQIFNSLGAKVFEGNLNETKGELDISYLSSGIYTVRITSDGKTHVEKIVKY